MNIRDARQRAVLSLQAYAEAMISKRDKAGKPCCPFCKSGTGKGGTSAFSIDSSDKAHPRYKCFACGESGDIFDLIGAVEGIQDTKDQIGRAAEFCGLELDEPGQSRGGIEHPAPRQAPMKPAPKEEEPAAEEPDYTEYLKAAEARLEETDYHRGLSLETLRHFHVGYDPHWRHPKSDPAKARESPRLIIPTSRSSYQTRDTRPDSELSEQEKNFKKPKVGKVHVFNAQALESRTETPLFIVEGEIDAMSICEIGAEAVGLGSIAYVKTFLREARKRKPTRPCIIALDTEKEGTAAAANVERSCKQLKAGLEALGVKTFIRPIPGGHDANELLTKDRAEFEKVIKGMEANVKAEAEAMADNPAEQAAITAAEEWAQAIGQEESTPAARAETPEEYRARHQAASFLQEFTDGILEGANTPPQPTGFTALDEALDGGLYEGLAVIGGISSVGKTTYVLQLATEIAESGRDVIIFSMEASKTNVIAKIISRYTHEIERERGGGMRKTARGITDARRYEGYTAAEKDAIRECLEKFDAGAAQHLYIWEPAEIRGIDTVIGAVAEHVTHNGEKSRPVVIVDYLQLLAIREESRLDYRARVDRAAQGLIALATKGKMPVICISSLNRDSYAGPVALNSFKESGNIEYSADVVMGIQFTSAFQKAREEDMEAEKKDNERDITVSILKNRNGPSQIKIQYTYNAAYNHFHEEGRL